MLGPPKSGKTTFCRNLAKKLGIIHIEIPLILDEFFANIKLKEENQETDEEGNPVPFLTPFEEEIINNLKNGQKICNNSLLQLVNNKLNSDIVHLKGFILDVPFYEEKS